MADVGKAKGRHRPRGTSADAGDDKSGRSPAAPAEDLKIEKRAAFCQGVRLAWPELNPEERARVEDHCLLSDGPGRPRGGDIPGTSQAELHAPTGNGEDHHQGQGIAPEPDRSHDGMGHTGARGRQYPETILVPSKNYIYIEDLNGLANVGKNELMARFIRQPGSGHHPLFQ